MTKKSALDIFNLLKSHYPDAKMILNWGNNFELLVAIILSAQCTDKKVNEVTNVLFPKYRKKINKFESLYDQYTSFILSDPPAGGESKDLPKYKVRKKEFEDKYQKYLRTLGSENEIIEIVNTANSPIHELEKDIYATGFYHNKAKNIREAAKVILEKYQGILPRSLDELTTIPGVGRKTANVFLGNAYHIYEGIAVDTHVAKQSQILGLTKNKNPEKIEKDLMDLFPKDKWFTLTYLLIEHGRNTRRKPLDRIKCNRKNCLLCNNK